MAHFPHHYRPRHHQPPPRHPPPPPPPPEVLEGDQSTGSARCYFCGQLIPREEDVRKTKYHVGHGHQIFVIICPACMEQKERGEGPFKSQVNLAAVLGLVVFVCVALLVVYFALIKPHFGGLGPRKELPVSGSQTAQENGLTLKVDRVETGGGSFRVWMTATNQTGDKLTLPLFGYFFVTDDLGNQYEADPFSSTFPRDVAPGATVSGYADMKKPLSDGASRLRVGFSTVFGSFKVKSITVEGVAIR